jgi:hypothetical protein
VHDHQEPAWKTSTFSDGDELRRCRDFGDGRIGIRSSKGLPDYSRYELAAFIMGAKAGEFDDLAGH